VTPAPLHEPDVGPVEARPFGQLLLAVAPCRPQAMNDLGHLPLKLKPIFSAT